jgi:glycosyltransferase involved in cell wall biosynthesis
VALAGLDIVCLTSFNEGTPVSLIEAQAAGKPILSTRVGGVEDVVQEENTALLCRSDHPEEFAEKLIRLASDPMLRKKLSGGGREFVLERFSYGRLVADMDSLYRHCLQNKAEPQDNKV